MNGSMGFGGLTGLIGSLMVALACLLLALRQRAVDADADGEAEGGGEADGERRRKGAAGRLRALGSLLRPDEELALAALKSRAMRAGLYSQDALDLFLTVRLIVIAAGTGLFLLILTSVDDLLLAGTMLVLIATLTIVGPSTWLDRRAQRRQAAIAESLPDMLELLAVCLEAGLPLQKAIERIVASGDDADLLADELDLVLSDIRVGMSVERAFARFSARIGSERAGALASVLGKASSLGAQIGELLRAHSRSMREQRLHELEELAGKANAKLALPLAVFLLPSGLMLLLAPPFMTLFELL